MKSSYYYMVRRFFIMLKRTTEEVKKYFKEHGCELLGEYQGAIIPMAYRCSCGRISKMNWNNFTKGKRCGYCSGKRVHKYTIKEVKKIFKEHGCELLENEYENGKIPMKYKCKCGRASEISLSALKHQKQHCRQCGIDKNKGSGNHGYKSYEEVKNYFQQQSCELTTSEWDSEITTVSKLKLKYICKCGRKAECSWNNFKKGKRCGYCHDRGRVKKFTFDEVKSIFENEECELLETEYINCGTPMQFKCSCGNIGKINLNHFKRGNRCHKCAVKKRTGPNHFRWRTDREQLKIDKKFRALCMSLLHRALKKTRKEKTGRTYKLLGYNSKELQEHVKSHPNWDEVKDGNWHLDHIFPIQAFLDYEIKDIKLINCLENLQPLSQHENNSKYSKYDKKEFEEWLNKKID